ncbi:MAG: ATP-binding protein [Clostridia bacterium]|nr:ATP-binding protein [Clostridia bacterium]
MNLHYEVNGDDFSVAGENSSKVKKTLKQLGFNPEIIRRVAIAMYEAEINMVIHANGGYIDAEITPERIKINLCDNGPGIPDMEKAMQEGFSTATNTVRELGFGAGMGLPNIKKYSDELNITTEIGKGTNVEIIINVV